MSQRHNIYEKFISFKKCVLLDTMYVILHLSLQHTCYFADLLHHEGFVTGLYLDKRKRLWQYIVEVDATWHNILCLMPESGFRSLKFK